MRKIGDFGGLLSFQLSQPLLGILELRNAWISALIKKAHIS